MKTIQIISVFLFVLLTLSISYAADNRKKRMRSIEKGWTVAWGKHINHLEYIKLGACMFDPTTACISAYFSNLLRDSISTLGREIALKALKNNGKTFTKGNIQIQAGIATYNHWHGENPCSIWGGSCWIRIKEPNTHQPYIRWRNKPKPSTSNPRPTRPRDCPRGQDKRCGHCWPSNKICP